MRNDARNSRAPVCEPRGEGTIVLIGISIDANAIAELASLDLGGSP
jgi:hypothetical protein